VGGCWEDGLLEGLVLGIVWLVGLGSGLFVKRKFAQIVIASCYLRAHDDSVQAGSVRLRLLPHS
jgi:hypothetical protein